MEIKVVRDISELETLESSWNAAVENSNFDSVFATYEWFYSWVRNFGKDKNVRIIVCRDGDKLLGVFPLLYEQKSFMGMKVGTLRSATNLHTPKYDFIVNGNGEEIIRSVFDYINNTFDWDFIELDCIPSDSKTISMLSSLEGAAFYRVCAHYQVESPYVSLKGNWESYLRKLDAKVRKNLHYYENKAGKKGNCEVLVVRNGDELERNLLEAFEIERSGWKGDAGTAIANSSSEKGFYMDLAMMASKKGWLEIDFLLLNGEKIAFDFCLRYKDRFNALKTGYNPRFATLAPGKVLRKKILRNLFNERSHRVYDLLGEKDGWKDQWTSDTQVLSRVLVFNKKLAPIIRYKAMRLEDRFKQYLRSHSALYSLLKAAKDKFRA